MTASVCSEQARQAIPEEPPAHRLRLRLYSLYAETLENRGQLERAKEWFEKSMELAAAAYPESGQDFHSVNGVWVGAALIGLGR